MARAAPTRSRARAGSHLDAILDAAEAVVAREGMGRLTLDAVARQAGLSKAGLLYHFPSMGELVGAVVVRHTSAWHAEFLATYERLRGARDTRPAVNTMMATCLAGTHAWSGAERARSRVMVAALVHDERHVEPLREVYRSVAELLKRDALPPGAAETIHLVVHGLWFHWIFGLGEVSAARLRSVRGALAGIGGFAVAGRKAQAQTHDRTHSSRRNGKRGGR